MNATSYNLIAVGVVFTSLNVYVGYVQLLLPTCFGFVLVAAGCWRLRFDAVVYRWAALVAAVLAAMTLPDLFAYSWGHPEYPGALSGFYGAVYRPVLATIGALYVGISGAIAFGAMRQKQRILAGLALAAAAGQAGMTAWWVLHVPASLGDVILSELLNLAAGVLLAAVCAGAGRRLA